MSKFFISVGTVNEENESAVALNDVKVKIKDNHYLYIPVAEHSFKNRQEMIDKLTEIAGKMWDKIECNLPNN